MGTSLAWSTVPYPANPSPMTEVAILNPDGHLGFIERR